MGGTFEGQGDEILHGRVFGDDHFADGDICRVAVFGGQPHSDCWNHYCVSADACHCLRGG